MRADGDEHLFSIWCEDDIARPVAATPKFAPARDIGDNGLHLSAWFNVSIFVRKADDRVGVADIYPLGIRPERIKRDTERPFQIGCVDLIDLRFSAILRRSDHSH